MNKHHKSGFTTVEILLTLILVAVIALIGAYVYKNSNKPDKTTTDTTQQESQSPQTSNTPNVTNFGTDGVTITSKADVDKLTTASESLKAYFSQNVGQSVQQFDGQTTNQVFTIYSVYGDYASGSASGYNFGVIWGPQASGNDFVSVGQPAVGNIGVLIGMQAAPNCQNLKKLNVPVQVFDNSYTGGTCLSHDQEIKYSAFE